MNALERFRTEKDDFYRTSPHSPLNADQKRSFHGLRYFPENTDLDLEVGDRGVPRQARDRDADHDRATSRPMSASAVSA